MATVEGVRNYWRRRALKAEAALKRERVAHESAMACKLVAVQSDPAVPRGSMFILAAPSPHDAAPNDQLRRSVVISGIGD